MHFKFIAATLGVPFIQDLFVALLVLNECQTVLNTRKDASLPKIKAGESGYFIIGGERLILHYPEGFIRQM